MARILSVILAVAMLAAVVSLAGLSTGGPLIRKEPLAMIVAADV